MIETEEPNINPMSFSGGVFKKDVTVISRAGVEPVSFAFDTKECDYRELAFAKVGGEGFENDKSAFLFTKSLATDTITIKLFKNDVEIATITDNTYGIFSSTFASQPLKVGFLLEWEKVLNLEGTGCYKIAADSVIINQASTNESICYNLKPFTEEAARDTVVIKSFQNGNIEFGVDYTGMNWEQRIRVEGNFKKLPREFIIENYRDTLQKIEQIQHGVERFYILKTKLIPFQVSNPLMDDLLHGNSLFMTDYDLYANERFIDLKVYPIQPEDEIYPTEQTKGFHSVKLSNVDRIRKRN